MQPDAVLGNGAQDVLPEMVEYTFPPWIVGLYVAAVLAAIMSTVSSLLVMAAGSLTHDLYARVINPGLRDADAARLCRIVTLAMAALALAVLAEVHRAGGDSIDAGRIFHDHRQQVRLAGT